ncbi:hypothetical protein [Catenulispora rubra]|uniref:hypothetical protein n=1 Tax=Catenulispora rubra TaxID=280293 RepID=UPI001892357E|nr:hypothetical protein [Catenulispora rubra]
MTAQDPFTDRIAGLAVTAAALRQVAEGNQLVAKLLVEGIDALRADATGSGSIPLTDDGREPGFFRVPTGTGAHLEPAERGALHVAMAASLSGMPAPDTAEIARSGEQRIAEIIADLWAMAARYDLNVGCIIEASLAAVRARVIDGDAR